MKIAIISDIHSNYNYLVKVFESIKQQNVSAVYCTGDMIGYYDNPNDVINFIRDHNVHCVLGNHEEYFLGTTDYNKEHEYLYGILKQRDIVSIQNKIFLEELPKKIEISYNNDLISVSHSNPVVTERYYYNAKDIELNFLKGYNYYIYGHTHIPLVAYYYGHCIVNPGSVGQPRDYTSMPSYALLDLDKKEVTIKKINVDTYAYVKILEKKNFDIELTSILTRRTN